MESKNVVIIGAGAAGLFCAAQCGRRGRSVLVLDHGDRTGSKVRISGGGRCNFTNLNASAEHYLSSNPHFCRSALAGFTPRDFLSLLQKHRIPYSEKEAGQLFCDQGSRAIIDLLEKECAEAGVEVRLKCRVASVSRPGPFLLSTSCGAVRSDSLVIATGGLSFPNLGASGFGHELAKQLRVPVLPVRPALVPFVLSPKDRAVFSTLAGISLPASVRIGRRTVHGSMLLTHRGLSGPVMLNASLYWQAAQPLIIDLLPGTDIGAVLMEKRQSRAELRSVLAGHLPKRFAEAWCEHAAPSRPLNQISDKDLRSIAQRLRCWEIAPAGTEGYATAEVTAGGVDTHSLSSRTMEAKNVPGLYFAGEVMDVTGELGGYNLHWAWASGFAAGMHA